MRYVKLREDIARNTEHVTRFTPFDIHTYIYHLSYDIMREINDFSILVFAFSSYRFTWNFIIKPSAPRQPDAFNPKSNQSLWYNTDCVFSLKRDLISYIFSINLDLISTVKLCTNGRCAKKQSINVKYFIFVCLKYNWINSHHNWGNYFYADLTFIYINLQPVDSEFSFTLNFKNAVEKRNRLTRLTRV